MNFAETLRGLVRRWYIVVPGVVVAVALALVTFAVVKPGYERTATQLLLPGEGTVPVGATNPFLFLGSLTQAADVLVRSLNSEEAAGAVAKEYPGTDIVVTKDPTTSGPVILITVNGKSDSDVAAAVDEMLTRSAGVLARVQTDQKIKTIDRITISTLTHDRSSTLQQRNRIIDTVGVGAGTLVFALLLASVIDGLSLRGRRRRGSRVEGVDAQDSPHDAALQVMSSSPSVDGDADFHLRDARRRDPRVRFGRGRPSPRERLDRGKEPSAR